MTEVVICIHCGKAERKHKSRRGYCNSCLQFKRRHGFDKPLELGTMIKCQNAECDRQVKMATVLPGSGLCKRCRQYQYEHGKPWSKSVTKRGKYDPRPICSICKERKAERTKPANMCHRCYCFWYRNKKRRPRWRDAECCSNCKQPRSYEKGAFVKGRCRKCYNYWKDNNTERPQKLWKVGELGWCDCGQPAKHEIIVAINHHHDRLIMCDDCYAEEQRQRRIYGATYDRKGTGSDSGTQPGYSHSGDD